MITQGEFLDILITSSQYFYKESMGSTQGDLLFDIKPGFHYSDASTSKTANAKRDASTRKGKILILVFVLALKLMPASRQFSR